jgi:hypothetical protein
MKTCIVAGCDRPSTAHGYCGMHLKRYLRHGNPLTTVQPRDGRRKHPLYLAWHSMRERSRRSGKPVCERWGDFWLFVQDMGPKPPGKMMLTRIDGAGAWEPGNCRWGSGAGAYRAKGSA